MFESILEGLLNKYLGEYVEGLSRDDLNLSIWGGDIELHDVKLKKDLFKKFKLPLALVYGKIGRLRLQVPWRSLGSKPVIAEIEDIWLVVSPLTEMEKWESVETMETSYDKKEELIREMARELFQDLIKTAEDKKKEQGMTASMITRIVDNLQVSLKNLHIRVEREDVITPQNSFSLGITLQEIDLYTTDANWERIYIDRTKDVNKRTAMHKVLKIKNFGIYYKTGETSLISQTSDDEEKESFLMTYKVYDEEGRVQKQADDYLINPLRLNVKLVQNDPETALNAKSTLMNLIIQLEEFGITVQKGQYDNVQMLLELTSEYMRFLSSDQLRQRQQNLNNMNDLLKSLHYDVTKGKVRTLYSDIFTSQLDLILKADPKKPEKLMKALEKKLDDDGSEELYRAVVRGMNSEDLEHWARQVVQDRANLYKRDEELKKQNKSQGFMSRLFYGKEEEKSEEEKEAAMRQIEKDIAEHAAKMTSISGHNRARQNIPDINLNFKLDKISLTLVSNIREYRGVTLQAEDFAVDLNVFDGTNKYNKNSMDLKIKLENYGLWRVFRNLEEDFVDFSPFLQKLLRTSETTTEDDEFFDAQEEVKEAEKQHKKVKLDTMKPLTEIYLALGNKEHHNSDLGPEEIDETDLTVSLEVQPLEIIYRAETMGDIARFFKVKKMSDQTKIQALAKYNELAGQVNKMTEYMDQDFQNNKIMINVAAPTLVIPFQQKTWDAIQDSECWVFTMGNVGLCSYKGDDFNNTTHEAFELKVERVKFEHANRYCVWKDAVSHQQSFKQDYDGLPSPMPSPMLLQQQSSENMASPVKKVNFDQASKQKKLRMTQILEDFSASVLVLKKRSETEMHSDAMLQLLLADMTPKIEIKAQLDDEMHFSLRPAVFQKLVKIGTLFAEGEKPEHYYKNKMLKKLKKSPQHGPVKMLSALGQLRHGTAALIEPSSIYFWPENKPQEYQIFDLLGCEESGGWQANSLGMVFTNANQKKIELHFSNHQQTTNWAIAMSLIFKQITQMKQGILGLENAVTQSQVQLPDDEEGKVDAPLTSQGTSSFGMKSSGVVAEVADFGLQFTVPKVCLTLKTRKKLLSKRLASVSDSNEWELHTYLDQIYVSIEQKKDSLELKAAVSQLKVCDNSNDERFPFIFQNLPVEGQEDLVTFALKTIEKKSKDFTDCECQIDLGFSGLVAYWKPQTMINLLEFINENQATTKKRSHQNVQLDKDLSQQINKETSNVETQSSSAANIRQSTESRGIDGSHKGCLDKPFFQVKVKVTLAYLKALFMHPDNNTYPIFSIIVQQTMVDYWKKCDHDEMKLLVKNLQVFDNTSYPDTFDPFVQYKAEEVVQQKEILGLNNNAELQDENMLNLTLFMFQYPQEVRCEKQDLLSVDKESSTRTDHNMLMKMELQQMRLIYMQEQMLRIVDYSLNCIAKLFNTGQANADILESESDDDTTNQVDDEMQSEYPSDMQSLCIESEAAPEVDFWADFDIQQEPYCPKLDLHLSCPLIIIPNLNELSQRFELDFGTIRITSDLIREKNRWINHPDKIFHSMQVTVRNENLRFDFKEEDDEKKVYKPILKEDHIDVQIVVPQGSPFFEEKNERGADLKPPMPIDDHGNLFDMDQVDTSVQVAITQSLLKLNFKQDVIIELFSTLEHNIMKQDKFSEEFSHALRMRQATIVQQSSLQATRKGVQAKLKKHKTEEMEEEYFSDDSENPDGLKMPLKLKKKTVQVTIHASCLSIELRKTDDTLIAEFCMVNFDYGLQMFCDGVMKIYFNAYSFFIFHDEDPFTSTKQVMFGHINAQNQLVTSTEFYHTLPEKIRQEKLNSKGADIAQAKPRISYEMIMDPNSKTNTMNISMHKLKFFLRPQVFNEISEFTILCLKKLDLKKNNEKAARRSGSQSGEDEEDEDPMNDSFINPVKGTADDKGTTSVINFKLLQSIFILERREFQKKAAVVQMGISVNMRQYDQRAIERQLAGQKLRHTGTSKNRFKPVSYMKVNLKDLTPFVMNIKDLESTKFKQAKKRPLISAFNFQLEMKSDVAQADMSLEKIKKPALLSVPAERELKKPPMKFKNRNSMDAKLSTINAQVSMDDLYVVNQLAGKVSEESIEVGKMWQDYQESSIVTDAEKKRQVEQDIVSEDSMHFLVEGGADIVIINEDGGNFVPMFLLSCETINFNQQSGLRQVDNMDGEADTKCSLYYFNSQKGYWEPAIERFTVNVLLKRVGKANSQTILLPEPLNINISVHLGGVIHSFMNLWEKSTKRAKVFQKKMQTGNESALRASTFYKSGVNLIKNQNVMLLNADAEAMTDAVTPYAIRNLTDREFSVKSLSGGGNFEASECKIAQGEIKGLAVNFQETLDMAEDVDGRKKIVSKDQFVKVDFASRSMAPITKFKLNQNCTFVKHQVFGENSKVDAKIKNLNHNREFYVIQNLLEDQRRVLTVRTQHVLTNRTQSTTYKVKQFFVEKIMVDGKQKKEINIFHKADLRPGESIPLPDTRDLDVVKKLKICLRPQNCKKWSDEFKVSALKEKLDCGENIVWNHYKTYSILRKESTSHPEVFNYFLMPTLIIKNCLPMTVRIDLSCVMKTEEERKAMNRTEVLQNSRSSAAFDGGMKKFLSTYTFQRGEEKIIDNMDSQSSRVDIKLHLNDRTFEAKGILLQQANEASNDEREIVFTDTFGRSFSIYVRIDTTTAGNKVVLYAKNVLLCHTEQSIEFFYQKKNDMFDEDNANEFPLPVRDNRNNNPQTLSESTMITDSNSGNEPTIYIHKEHNTMCASLTAVRDLKSNLVPINTPGQTGQFDIPRGDMLYQFQCSTATYQPSEKEQIFTRMVEVSPKYIVCNMSSQDIYLSQAHKEMDQVEFCMGLKPNDRQPFHWSDKTALQHIKFWVYGAVRPTTSFTIADCGSLSLTNVTQDGSRHFFQVTKRLVLNSNFIIIEDMKAAPYKIDNLSHDVFFDYFQVGKKVKVQDIETCNPGENRPFAWRDVLEGSQFLLNTRFYVKRNGEVKILVPKKCQDKKRPNNLEYSLDELNRSHTVEFVMDDADDDGNLASRTVYVSVYTDQNSKVFEISDEPSTHIFETDKDKKKYNEIEELKYNDEVSIMSSVVLSTVEENGEEDKEASEEENRTRLDICQVNVSLIKQQTEIMTLVFDKYVSIISQKKQEWIFEAQLSRMQIDNHGQVMPLFPVILKPKCTNQGKPHNHFTMENVEPCLQMYTSIRTDIPNVQYVNWLEFLVKELELRIELEHLMSIIEFAQAFNEKFEAGLASSHQIFIDANLTIGSKLNDTSALEESKFSEDPINDSSDLHTAKPKKTVQFTESTVHNRIHEERKGALPEEDSAPESQDEDEIQRNQLKTWRSNLLTESEGMVYIEKFKGSPLSIDISIFKQTRSQEHAQSNSRAAIVDTLSNLGLQFTNISGAPMQLNALEIPHVYGSHAVVQDLLINHYSSNIRSNVLKFMGSSDLLGNPTDFVNTLGTGAKQFYYAPRDGFMQGPLQGGIGLLKGTGSLLAHAAGGVSGSVSKITNTLNRGLLVLSADTEYRQKKEIKDIEQKPSGVLDGMGKGLKGFGKSLWSGVSGIVTQPIKGAKEEGFAGFGKGIGKGVLGTVVKPVSGVVDLVSKTTEGIESAVDGGICRENDTQMRMARSFYKHAGIFREYTDTQAVCFDALRSTLDNNPLQFASDVDVFYGALKLGRGHDDENVLDSDVLLLTSGYAVVVKISMHNRYNAETKKPKEKQDIVVTTDWKIMTHKLLKPTEEDPNPVLQGDTLRINFKRVKHPVNESKELVFKDASKAKAAYFLFQDLFYMMYSSETSQ